MSVILTWWQIQDGIADHGFWSGLKYRAASWMLRRAYRKARLLRPAFDEGTQRHLKALSQLEKEKCPSIDAAADTFAQLQMCIRDRHCGEYRRHADRSGSQGLSLPG